MRGPSLPSFVVGTFVLGAGVVASAQPLPSRSFERLVTGNGHFVASYDRTTRRIDTFLEHPYRFAAPRNDPADLCYQADETRDLAYDAYFGVRADGAGEWLSDVALDEADYLPGTNVIRAMQHAGPDRSLRVETFYFAPMGIEEPVLVMIAEVENVGTSAIDTSLHALANFHLGAAGGGREPSANDEEASWDAARATLYEYGPSQGTVAYVAITPLARASVSTGAGSAHERLRAGDDLDDVRATTAPANDVSPGFQAGAIALAPGERASMAIAIVWALDEDAGPDVDAVRAWAASRTARALVDDEVVAWNAWHTEAPAGVDGERRDLWRQAAVTVRIGQVREPGGGFGQILASLPPGLGFVDAQWNIAWVRDMAYAVVGLVRAGHLEEARAALEFQLRAPRGRHEAEVGRPYRISVTRYFGNGQEESDCNADGPNVEFDGFGLFLWSLGEYLRAGGDRAIVDEHWEVISAEIADVLVSLVDDSGVISADSSIWEVHWNGRQRRFTYTSLAAVRGLCDAAELAELVSDADAGGRYRATAEGIRAALVSRHVDPRGALAQSAEDLIAGHHYVDAATVEAIDWGIVDPNGGIARATLDALLENLTVQTGVGLMRNDDGGFYDSQEWVFVDLRLLPALEANGRTDRAGAIRSWIERQALANDAQFSELHDAATGAYAGSIPMVGFGAGAYLIALSTDPVAPPACGAYATEPVAPTPDAGPLPDAGHETCEPGYCDPGGCDCSAAPGAPHPPLLFLLLLLPLLLLTRPRRVDLGDGSPLSTSRPQPREISRADLGDGSPLSTWRRALHVVLAALALLAGCGGDAPADAGVDGALPGDADAPPGLCPVTVSYRATDSTPTVHVAGAWNAFSPTADQLLDDGSGTYARVLWLAPGLYPYKLVVEGDGREPWRLDPENHYRAYEGGVENSGLRVPDCFTPALVIESAGGTRPAVGNGRIDATLRYDARRAGSLASVAGELRSGRDMRALATSELATTADRVTVSIAGLAEGKHTVRLVATDAAGVESEPVLLPVWIEADPFDWRDALIYMGMTDRFANGDASNDGAPAGASAGAEWSGGDLAGLAQAIRDGYLDALGVRAIWLTPFNDNPDGVYSDADGFHQVAGYHGYWPDDPREVDPRLGGEAALDDLVATAHEHGIRVLMDLVLNHVHEAHPYFRDHPTWFNEGCICGTFDCDWTARRLDCLFRDYMPDVDWTSTDASEAFIADALWWLERFDLDGFRVDAVKHVVDGAIFDLGIRVRERFETAGTRYFLMGETAQGWDPSSGPTEGGNPENYGIISRYVRPWGLDGQFDFVLYYAAALQFLRDEPGRGMLHVDYWTRASQEQYPPGAIMTPYIGSHDTSRFMSLTAHPSLANNKWDDLPPQPDTDEPYDRMYVALAWLLAIPGAPLLYYGDEYGEYGGADPDNRHRMRFGSALSAREARQLDRVRELGQARRELPALRRGAYRSLTVTDDLWSVARGEGDDLVVVVLNRSAAPLTQTIPLPTDVAGEGRSFTDALGSGTTAAVERAAVRVTLPPRSALYLH